MLNISMSKLMHYRKILGAEVLKKYKPENYAKIVATTNIKFKERMLFVCIVLVIRLFPILKLLLETS